MRTVCLEKHSLRPKTIEKCQLGVVWESSIARSISFHDIFGIQNDFHVKNQNFNFQVEVNRRPERNVEFSFPHRLTPSLFRGQSALRKLITSAGA